MNKTVIIIIIALVVLYFLSKSKLSKESSESMKPVNKMDRGFSGMDISDIGFARELGRPVIVPVNNPASVVSEGAKQVTNILSLPPKEKLKVIIKSIFKRKKK